MKTKIVRNTNSRLLQVPAAFYRILYSRAVSSIYMYMYMFFYFEIRASLAGPFNFTHHDLDEKNLRKDRLLFIG